MLNQYKFPEVVSRGQKLQQIESWVGSETDKSSDQYHDPKRIKFPHNVSLHAACYAANKEDFKRLLNIGIDINCRNQDGMSCVHQCCINGDYEFLEFLISEGADVNVQDNEGWSPLHAAASVEREDMVKLLLDNNADPSLLSCEMELPIDVTKSQEVIDLLNASMQARGVDPVATRQCEEQLLLTHAKHWAATGDNSPHVDPCTGATPLHVAACKNYIGVLEVLLSIPGIPLDAQDNDGWTALHAAVHWNKEQPARMLAEAGASFDIFTHANQSVFHLADCQFAVILRQLRDKQRANPKTVPDIRPDTTTTTVATAPSPSPVSTGVDPHSAATSAVSADSSLPRPPTVTKNPDDAKQSSTTSESSDETSSLVGKPVKRLEKPGEKAALSGDGKAPDVAGRLSGKPVDMSSSDSLQTSLTSSLDSEASLQNPSQTVKGDEATEKRPKSTATPEISPPRPSLKVQSEPLEISLPSQKIRVTQPPTLASSGPSPVSAGDRYAQQLSVNGGDQAGPHRQQIQQPWAGRDDATANGPLGSPPDGVSLDTITTTKATIRAGPLDQSKASTGKSNVVEQRQVATTVNSTAMAQNDRVPQPQRFQWRRTSPSNNITGSAQDSLAVADMSEIHRRDALHRQTNASAAAAAAASPDRPGLQQTCRRSSMVSTMAKNDETETQRTVKARYVRSTRRSTQGVSADEIEEAMRLSGVHPPSSTATSTATSTANDKNNNAAIATRTLGDNNHHQPAGSVILLTGGGPQTIGGSGSVNSYRQRDAAPHVDRQPVRVSRTSPRQPRPITEESQKAPVQYLTICNRRNNQPLKITDYLDTQRCSSTDQQDGRTASEDSKTSTLSTNRLVFSGVNSITHTKDASATTSGSTGRPTYTSTRQPVEREKGSLLKLVSTGGTSQQKPTGSVASNTTNGSIIPRPTSRILHNSDALSAQQANQQQPPSSKDLHSGSTTTGSASTFAATTVVSSSTPRVLPAVTSRYSSGNSLITSDTEQYSSRSQRNRGLELQPNFDYRRLYEEEKSDKERLAFELEQLKREIARLRVDLGRSNAENLTSSPSTSPTPVSNSSDSQPSIEGELKRLREENHRIREENGALIRVISKLSQPT